MPLKTSKAKKAAPAMVKGATKKGKKPVPVPEPEEESSEEEDVSDSSEEAVPVPVTKNAKKNTVAANSDGDSDEDEDDDESGEDDDSEEEPAPVVKSKKGSAVNGVKKQAAAQESDDDDDDDDDEESEEEEVVLKAKKGAKPAKAPVMEVDEDDSDDDEEESEEEEESDEEEEPPVQKKRKATAADKVPAKKAKVDADGVVSLYVANLAADIEDAKIRKFFKKNGISLSDVRHKAPKAFCYVDLEDADDLDKALALAGQKLKGQEVKIEQAKQRNEPKADKKTPQKETAQTPNKRADDNCLLFVKNLPEDVTKEMLEEVFDNAKDVRLPLNAEGNFRGFAFVEFHAEADVDTAMEDKQGTDVGGRSIFLDYTGSKSKGVKKAGSFGGAPQQRKSFGEAGKTKVLFVKNLSFNLTKESLAEAFDGATTARIATFPDTGKPRGFGFVEFDSPADATAAFDSMNGTELDGRELKLDYATENQNSPGGRGGGRGGRGGFDRGGRGGGFRGGRGFGGGRGRGGDRGGRGRGGFRGGSRGSGSRKTFDD